MAARLFDGRAGWPPAEDATDGGSSERKRGRVST